MAASTKPRGCWEPMPNREAAPRWAGQHSAGEAVTALRLVTLCWAAQATPFYCWSPVQVGLGAKLLVLRAPTTAMYVCSFSLTSEDAPSTFLTPVGRDS